MEFDTKGNFTQALAPIITSTNKIGSTLSNLGIYKNGSKQHCLIVGDSLDDAQMADGLSFDTLHKVVFAEKNLDEFQRRFDEVLDINADFSRIIELFD